MEEIDRQWRNMNQVANLIQKNSGELHFGFAPAYERSFHRPRGFGLMEFVDPLDATDAKHQMDRHELTVVFAEDLGSSALSSVLELGRAAKTNKLAIVNDAIRVVKQLRTEAEEYKEENKKLLLEIKSLKAEKNERGEGKLALNRKRKRWSYN